MTGASKSANKGSGDSLLSKSNTNTRLRTKVDMPEPTPDDVHRIYRCKSDTALMRVQIKNHNDYPLGQGKQA